MSLPSQSSLALSFAFTLNNYTESDYDSLVQLVPDIQDIEYFIVGKEVGASGTPHLQGFIKFKTKKRFSGIHKLLPCLKSSHLEVAYASGSSNSIYCKKDGDFFESGIKPIQKGKSKDEVKKSRNEKAIEITAMLESHKKIKLIHQEFPGDMLYCGHNIVKNYLMSVEPIIRPGIKVLWLYGPPGVGKSRMAHDVFPEAFIKEPRTKWWNDYMLQDTVIIDDFAEKGIDINHMLRWFDRYRCIVEVKGGSTALQATKFIVTSNFHPSEVFQKESYNPVTKELEVSRHLQHEALMRRINLLSFDDGLVYSDAAELGPLYTPLPLAEAISVVRDWFFQDGSSIRSEGCEEQNSGN